MNRKKVGLLNPFNNQAAHFEYEVVNMGELTYSEYDDGEGGHYVQPERQIVLRTLSGWDIFGNKFVCKTCSEDALKNLRQGEIVSVDLKFRVKEKDGLYEQIVIAGNIYTLHDYLRIREDEAFHQGSKSND